MTLERASRPRDEARDLAGIESARQIAARGDPARAERLLRAVLSQCGGSRSEAERVGASVLAQICVVSYRETEGLVLSRRAMRLSDAAGMLESAAASHNFVSAATEGLEDWDALEEEVKRMEARAPSLSDGPRRVFVVATLRRRVALSLGRGDFAAAEENLVAAERAARASEAPGTLGSVLPYDLAEVRLAADRHADALQALDAFMAQGRGPLPGEIALIVHTARTRAFFGLRTPDARARGEALFAVLEDPMAGALGLRRTLAVAAARDFDRAEPTDPLVDRAYAAAARMSIERALEIQAFLVAGGSAVPVEVADLKMLSRARDRLVARDARLSEAIAHRLPSSDAEHSFVDRRSGMRVRVFVCSMCVRVRVPGAAWIPVQQFVPVEATGWAVTHLVCDDCRLAAGPPASGTPAPAGT